MGKASLAPLSRVTKARRRTVAFAKHPGLEGPDMTNDKTFSHPTGALDVQTQEQAVAAAAQLAPALELAVDVEADLMHAFRGRLCFVQVGTDQDIFLFD